MTALLARARDIDLGGVALYRLIALIAGFGANVIAIAVLSRQHGSSAYAAFAIVASLVNLLPFADLGLGASIVNATSDRSAARLTRGQYRRTVSKARDFMVLLMLLVICVTALAYYVFSFDGLLGNLADTPGIPEATAYTFACIALAIPLGMGGRVLQGLGRMIDVVRIGLVGPLVQVCIYIPLMALGAPAYAYFLGPGTAYLATAAVGYLVARRRYGLRLNRPFTSWFSRNPIETPLWQTAAPFLIVSIGMSIGFQSHRVLLSHFGTPQNVAEYSLVAQFLGPLLAITGVVGQNLWARYRKDLHNNSLSMTAYKHHLLLFAFIGLIFSAMLFLLAPTAAAVLSDGQVSPPILLALAAALYLLVTAVHQPSAMLLSDTKGLWFQAACVVLVAASTVALIVLSVPHLGAAAPYLAMASSMLVLQVIPSIRVAFKRVNRQGKQ
ncbi:lipopolysaccharide biosynthesis protein [Paenarthrobacter histidinolovorans]|uniref:lipopolysaccharide biosynthesis protein n=1 Tax=Paenarthrobacter histidinolovorans TaxID=43664 RepID=UPI00166E1B5C|nr:oligosaccharide flippase family protein [Paenarthrobacter histidinolovorans]GGJ12317.1 hypothetical protein GCM10010052_07200 [Paenarthrobacter histidinolovorans]